MKTDALLILAAAGAAGFYLLKRDKSAVQFAPAASAASPPSGGPRPRTISAGPPVVVKSGGGSGFGISGGKIELNLDGNSLAKKAAAAAKAIADKLKNPIFNSPSDPELNPGRLDPSKLGNVDTNSGENDPYYSGAYRFLPEIPDSNAELPYDGFNYVPANEGFDYYGNRGQFNDSDYEGSFDSGISSFDSLGSFA